MHLGLHIKMARMSKGLTQEDLAEKINKTRPLISSIEQTGKVNYYTLAKICEILEVDANDLISMAEDKKLTYKNKQQTPQTEHIKQLEKQIEQLQFIIQSQQELIGALKEKLSETQPTKSE
ncbi:MAG: helix-turn-helix domain-containing protein [Bacteroidota bacterium]|jgi:transcriptional regulator with XRE-family HTH domain